MIGQRSQQFPILDQQVLREQQVPLDHKAYKELKETKVTREPLAPKDLLD